ncbi:MAG: hypothetical protein FJ395_13800 [Verrucomicrobia bacterium]|nr:hypothetical protein [Verrucomicrobiota bacterium]
MKTIHFLLWFFFFSVAGTSIAAEPKPRLVVMTDIGGDPHAGAVGSVQAQDSRPLHRRSGPHRLVQRNDVLTRSNAVL